MLLLSDPGGCKQWGAYRPNECAGWDFQVYVRGCLPGGGGSSFQFPTQIQLAGRGAKGVGDKRVGGGTKGIAGTGAVCVTFGNMKSMVLHFFCRGGDEAPLEEPLPTPAIPPQVGLNCEQVQAWAPQGWSHPGRQLSMMHSSCDVLVPLVWRRWHDP